MLAQECIYFKVFLLDDPSAWSFPKYSSRSLLKNHFGKAFPMLPPPYLHSKLYTCSYLLLTLPIPLFLLYFSPYYLSSSSNYLLGKSRWQSRRTYAHLLQELQNYNSLLNNCWQENAGFHRKDIPRPRAKEKPQQDGRRGKTAFRIKSHTTRDAWRAQTYLVCIRTQRPHRDWARTVSVRLLWRYRSAVAHYRVGCTEWCSACMGPFEGCHHCLHYLHHSLVSGQTTGREHSPARQQKIGLKIYWPWPHPSEQDPVSSTVSLPHQEASISLTALSLRGLTELKPQLQKTNQTDFMDHSLV